MKTPSSKKLLIASSLALAVQAALCSTAAANTTKKAIGDLEIYQTAKGGKVTITMMLDTSGSMLADVVDSSACDFPNGENFVTITTEKSKTTPSYDRTICTATGFKKYAYAEIRPANGGASIWYNCNNPGGATCTSIAGPVGKPSVAGYTVELASRNISIGGTPGAYYRYYKVDRPLAKPLVNADRLTRLKDALFKLLDKGENGKYLLDSDKVAIGIGQFSSQSGANNVAGIPDGTTGKILVPARLLTETQRNELKTVAAGLIGGGGTPSASAYAEAGAYMLGTTTNTTSNKILKEKYRVVVNPRDASRSYYACTAHSGSGLWCSTWTLLQRRPAEWDDRKTQRCRATNDTCYSEEISGTTVDKGLSGFAKSATVTKNGNNYISPLDDTSSSASCDGQGIYFLTDGEPNSSQQPELLMTTALGAKSNLFVYDPRSANNVGALPDGLQTFHGTPQVGLFARSLREAQKNPKNVSIRTAVVGFGSVFDISKYAGAERTLNTPELDPNTSLYIPGKFKGADATKYIDCSKIIARDAQNACNWGAKSHPELPSNVGGYGEGGFYSAQSTDDVIDSVTEFLGDLTNVINTAPSGTIVIPDDPYSVASQQAVAYMPMIEPKVASKDVIWPGNMKKYHIRQGTIYGKNAQRLYMNVKGDLNADAQDGWSMVKTDNNQVTVGGYYAHLKTPNAGVASVRKLFIEDFVSATDKTKTKTREFGVNVNGKITLDGRLLSASNNFFDTTLYTRDTVVLLLNFLGFTTVPTGDLANITLTAPTDAVKVVGSSPHSTPTAVSYQAKLDSRGAVSNNPVDREDYVLFGSMEGALHMVDARDSDVEDADGNRAGGGQELFSFIPKVMLQNQATALRKASTYTDRADGSPVFGVDAPWMVTANYDFDNDNKPTMMRANPGSVYAYGGFRLGGEGLYGLNISVRSNPQLAFALTPQSTGFERLGQIWAKPTKAKIKVDNRSTDVLIFGGGYDLCYENDNFQVGVTGETFAIANNQRGEACAGKTEAVGNAVYMVNAKTGALMWTASAPDMKHSVVGGVTTIDRDNDNNIDAIYFADLGGQVFRSDFNNTGATYSAVRTTRLLAPAGSGKYVRRFYEKPVVSIYRGEGGFNNGELFALVNVISGDRSNPTSKMRIGKQNADRLYGIFDTDIAKRNNEFYASGATMAVRNLADGDLKDLSGLTLGTKQAALNEVKTKKGWYHPIVDFDGYTNVNYGKGVGKAEVIGSLLFSSVYNPDKEYSTTSACVASIKGGTERQMYCLPYGVCLNERSLNGKGGFSPAGQGISELTLGPLDNTASGSRTRVLISNVGLNSTGGSNDTNRVNFNQGVTGSSIAKNQTNADANGGSGYHPNIRATNRFTMQPVRWYDNSVKN